MIEFVKTEDCLPPYGAPVLIKTTSGTVQHVTYMRDGADDCADWFEPYHFKHDDELKMPLNKVAEFARLPNWIG